MARDVNEIVRELRAAFVANPTLATAYGLKPGKTFDEQFSRVSVEAGDTYIVAMALSLAEQIQEADKVAVQAVIDNNHIGTGPWYVSLAKQFQWSDDETYNLVVDPVTGVIRYNKVVAENRIITQAAYGEGTGKIIIKVAAGEPGSLQPLTPSQQLNLENYLRQIKIAGIIVEVVNLPADLLELDCDVYYSPSYSAAQLQEAIAASLDKYSVNMSYNGVIYKNAVIDAIQAVPGVVDVQVNSLWGIQGDNRAEITRAYTTYSGYFNIKKTDGFPRIELKVEN